MGIKAYNRRLYFLSDQDDVWHPEKVEKIIGCFQREPKAMMVFHNGWLMKKQGELLEGNLINIETEQNLFKAEKNCFLECTVSGSLVNGMVMCISKELLRQSMPFPQSKGSHDQWLMFCAVLEDCCYYFNEKLAYYRLHRENTAGNSAYRGNCFDHINRLKKNITYDWKKQNEYIVLGKAMSNKLIEYGENETAAYKTSVRIYEIGEKLQEAFESNRIIGAVKLCKLFVTDIRYRRSGVKSFLYQLFSILIM